MKNPIALALVSCSLVGIATAQVTLTYPDSTGEIAPAVGNHPHLDITSVVVTANAEATELTFRINLAGNPLDSPAGTNWGKYLVAIRSAAGGATVGNGWGRPINFAPGMTHWIGTWADAGGNTGGGEIHTFSGATWSITSAPTVTKDATGITIVASAANLSLNPGETFSFDVYSSGGGNPDSAVDALSASGVSIAGWGGPFTTNAVGSPTNSALQFTLPGTLSFAEWIILFGLDLADQDPGDDPDGDTLTNQAEFDANLGLNPSTNDTDADGLDDNIEDGTMVYNGPTDPGTFPAISDSDGDGYLDGDEANGIALEYESDPTVRNYQYMTVAGDFPENSADHWASNGANRGTDMDRTADTDLIGQFGWVLDYHITALGNKNFKFAGNHDWNYSWGVGGPGGGNIAATFTASGIHRWIFNSKTFAYTQARVNFPDVDSYLAAYGLVAGADEDGDGLNNEAEFALMTDPTHVDTDRDLINDDVDPAPLVRALAYRDIVFSVNMNVQTAFGNFLPGTDLVFVDFFDGPAGALGDLSLTDADADGIWTGTVTQFEGTQGTLFGSYKFKTNHVGAPSNGYEGSISNRTLNLGTSGTPQVLGTVYFDNNPNLPGYPTWAAANAGGQAGNLDYDGDGVANGVEFFMGETGSSFTANPQPVGGLVKWPHSATATGATFKVWTSDNLSTWTDKTADAVDSGGFVSYLLPVSDPKLFVRLEVTVP